MEPRFGECRRRARRAMIVVCFAGIQTACLMAPNIASVWARRCTKTTRVQTASGCTARGSRLNAPSKITRTILAKKWASGRLSVAAIDLLSQVSAFGKAGCKPNNAEEPPLKVAHFRPAESSADGSTSSTEAPPSRLKAFALGVLDRINTFRHSHSRRR